MYDSNMAMNLNYDKQKKHYTADGNYFISTNLTWDNGWETMVFKRDPKTGDIDFTDLDVERYMSQDDAYRGHEKMISKWEAKS